MNVSSLRTELDAATHDARMRRMVELGKRAPTDPAIAETLDTLAGGEFYERMLALQACYGSRDGARAVRFLSDPSHLLQQRARKLVARFASDVEVQNALLALPHEGRLALLTLLRRVRRIAPIDAFLDVLAEREPIALPAVLPYGSSALVARHFVTARPRCGEVFWKRLARLHPEQAARAVEVGLGGNEAPEPQLLHEATLVLTALAKRSPDLAVGLATRLTDHLPLVRLLTGLHRLVVRRPVAVADLLLASPDAVPLSFDPVAHRLDQRRLEAILHRRPDSLTQPTLWFSKLRPATRMSLFATFGRHWRDDEGCIPLDIVAELPAPARRSEASRHWGLPALATRPRERLPYAACLSWNEALTILDPWLKHPDGELRGLALQTLTATTRYERSRLADLLALVRAKKHEQDPVRCLLLAGLEALPLGGWHVEHLEALGQILRDALSASDLSAMSALYAERLVVALLRFHPAWAAEWLATLARSRGRLYLGNLQDHLTTDDIPRIAPNLLPVLRSWQNRERQGQLVAFAVSLGRRLATFSGLVEILEEEVQVLRTAGLADSILSLFASHCKGRLAALVPTLLAADPSWATRPAVFLFLHRRRQDLLTPFLGQRAYEGRYSTGRTRFVMPFDRGFFRWTPAQQKTFEKTLLELTKSEKDPLDTWTILRAVAQLAGLPNVDFGPLALLAADERPAVQEGTLRVLGRLDAGQGVPTLLEAMGDDRARIAIYALRAAILAMPADQAVALLRGVPLGKITVAKECLRLLGEIPTADAFAELQRLSATMLHRDVRIALLRALWGHLDRREAWAILDQAGESPDAAIMNSVVRIPADGLSESSRRRLSGLLLRLLEHPEPSVRLAVLQRFAALPIGDPERVLIPALLKQLASPLPDERQAAATAVFSLCRLHDTAMIEAAFADLLPQRRALVAAIQSLRATVRTDPRRLVPPARAILNALAIDPLTAVLRAGLALTALPWQELVTFLESLAAEGQLGPDVLAACVADSSARTDGADLERLETALARHPDERLRRLALAALVARVSMAEGWTEECVGRLLAYRLDPSPMVAAAAQFTFPPDEQV